MKQCRRCETVTDQFGVDKSKRDGLNIYCKECIRERTRTNEQKYRDRPWFKAKRRRQSYRDRYRARMKKLGASCVVVPTTKERTEQIWQQERCVYCGIGFTSVEEVTIDHVFPLAKGGTHVPENLVGCCRSCNSSKNDKILFTQWVPPIMRNTE